MLTKIRNLFIIYVTILNENVVFMKTLVTKNSRFLKPYFLIIIFL